MSIDPNRPPTTDGSQPAPGAASWTPPTEVLEHQKKTTRKRPWYLDIAYVTVWVGGIGALIYALLGVAVPAAIKAIPPETEAELFAGMWEDVESGMTEQDFVVAAEIDRIVTELASHWEGNDVDFRVGIMHEEAPNAFAMPGAIVVVTTGLLEQVESENELALVLGHELGHFYHRHHLEGIGRSIVLMVLVAMFTDGGSGLITPGAGKFISRLTERGFSRAQETECDEFGLELVYNHYGHVNGAGDFFARLPGLEGTFGQVANYMSTHPMSADRVDNMYEMAEDNGWPRDGQLTPLNPILQSGWGAQRNPRTP